MTDVNKKLTELKANVTPLNTAKFLAGTLISCGTMSAVVMALTGATTNAKGITKLMMRLGIFVLGCKAGDMAEKYFDETFDNFVEVFKEVQEEEKNEPDTK